MPNNQQRRSEFKPPSPELDEGYWSALLNEGEFARSVPPEELETNTLEPHDDAPRENEPFYRKQFSDDWLVIQKIAESDETLSLKVVGYNRGGLLVEWRSLRGFVPASQLLNFPTEAQASLKKRALIDHVGRVLNLRVIELQPEKNRLILSERAAQAEPGERDELLNRLSPGDVICGCVTNLTDFGAFIDLGGIEGLIHISELSWGRVSHPSDILQRGQEIDVYVLEIDQQEQRVALSLKRLHPDPWETVHERYQLGEIIQGEVTNVVDFGAFVCLEEGLEGLVHVSELAEGQFLHPRNVVREGEIVRARIIHIDGEARRLGLSLRLVN